MLENYLLCHSPLLPNVVYYAIYPLPIIPYYALKNQNRLLTL